MEETNLTKPGPSLASSESSDSGTSTEPVVPVVLPGPPNLKRLSKLSTQDYIHVMKSTPSLVEMTRNPFVLRLFVEVLPDMFAAGISLRQITRYTLDTAFVKKWFTREVARKSGKEQALLGVLDGNVAAVIDMFELLCALLALEMLKTNVLEVKLAQSSILWRDVKNAAQRWLRADDAKIAKLRQDYDGMDDRQKSRCVRTL